MKPRTFYSGWNDYTPTPDKSMTGERAYNLMRAWRRHSREPANSPRLIFKRVGRHEYKVASPSYPNDWHVIKWS